jgi:hypothetical protein
MELRTDELRTDEPIFPSGKIVKFKLKLSLQGYNIQGDWLCRAVDDALAYKNYCETAGTPRQFREYKHTDGRTYWQDQEGNWLSYDNANVLYMSYWHNSAAWKIENNRLIRVPDGAVLTWVTPQRWPLASSTNFLFARPVSPMAIHVERVEV